MNKRYYEHTLPIIRGSLSNTYVSVVLVGVFFLSKYASEIPTYSSENVEAGNSGTFVVF